MQDSVAPDHLPLRLIAVMVLTHASFTSMRLALMLAALQQGASTFGVGVIVSLMMIVPVFSSMAIGRWSDRVGHLPPVLWGLGLILAGGLLAGTRQALPVMAAAAVLIGSGQAMVQVALMDAIGHAGKGSAAQRFSALSLGFSISAFVGPIFTGLAIDHSGHAVALFALCLPAAAGWLLALRSGGAVRPLETPAAVATGGLWSDSALRAVLVVTGLLAMSWDLFTFVMPVHATALGLSATAIGTIAGSFAAGCFCIRLVLTRLSRHCGEERLLWTALAGTAACYAVFPLAGSFHALAALAFVLGLFLGGGQPMAMSLLHRSAPSGRGGEAMGVRTVVVSISQTALPLVFGGLGAALGTGPVFLAVAVTVGGGMVYVRRRTGSQG